MTCKGCDCFDPEFGCVRMTECPRAQKTVKLNPMEKLEELIEDDYGSIEEVLFEYLRNHSDVFDTARVANLISNLHLTFIQPRIERFDFCRHRARENAVSLKKYLEGNMYDSEEAAKANVGCQIENAQRIIDLCDGKIDSI